LDAGLGDRRQLVQHRVVDGKAIKTKDGLAAAIWIREPEAYFTRMRSRPQPDE
jgi:hypothetical protein